MSMMEKIECLLKRHNWTHYTFARKTGIPYSTVTSTIGRNGTFSVKNTERVAKTFKICPGYLMDSSGFACPNACDSPEDAALAAALLETFWQLDAVGKKNALKALEDLRQGSGEEEKAAKAAKAAKNEKVDEDDVGTNTAK